MGPMPLWFKLFLGLSSFLALTGSTRYLFRKQILEVKRGNSGDGISGGGIDGDGPTPGEGEGHNGAGVGR